MALPSVHIIGKDVKETETGLMDDGGDKELVLRLEKIKLLCHFK